MTGLSLRGYAAHRKAAGLRGGTLRAVQEAASVRLRACLTEDGKIRDAAEADALWEATTKADRVPLTGPGAKGAAPDYAESRARREAAEAALAELKLAKERGELVLAKDAEARFVAVISACKTRLLGIPSRARQRDPTVTDSQHRMYESLLREALEDLANPEGLDALLESA